jgi:hypothetical protein
MKNTSKVGLAVLILAAVIGLAGCQRGIEQKVGAQAKPAATVQAVERKKDGSPVYYCNAPTKAGGLCKRRVKAEGLHCWMHQKQG